jgi:hypothetical protein
VTSEPFARRRVFVFGKPKPNAVIGRNREPGEIALLLVGGLAGLMWGLTVPLLPLRILGLVGFPVAAIAAVYLPFRKRTLYRWFEIDRSYRRLTRTGRARWRSAAMEAGTRLGGVELEVAPPPGIGRIRWTAASFGGDEVAVLLHLDRKFITATVEIEGPGVGSVQW